MLWKQSRGTHLTGRWEKVRKTLSQKTASKLKSDVVVGLRGKD